MIIERGQKSSFGTFHGFKIGLQVHMNLDITFQRQQTMYLFIYEHVYFD